MPSFQKEESFPCVRKDLEFIPIQHDQQRVVLVRDHLGLVGEGTAVPLELFQLMTMLDGTRSPRDIQMYLIRKKAGMLVDIDEVNKIIEHLDQLYLLESQRYLEARKKIISDFTSSSIRPCSHAGTSYPAEPLLLQKRLDEIMDLAPHQQVNIDNGLSAAVAPHIDLSVGATGYATAYRLVSRFKPDRVLILGVGHQMMDALFSVTTKDFETPLGMVQTDKEAAQRLGEADSGIVSKNDFPHRTEHSIEFQVVFLQHVLKDTDFSIVPVLCGSVWANLSPCTRESYKDKTGPFLRALQDIVQEKGQNTLVVAGVDLSHIGPKFGHNVSASHMKTQAQAHDKVLLEALLKHNQEKFWQESLKVRDQYNVCGFSALACLMEILPPSRGILLHYDMWFEPPTQSAVSFCAAGFIRT